MNPTDREPLRLLRVDVHGDQLLDALMQDPTVAPTGFSERDIRPDDMLSGDAFLWRIRTADRTVGMVWLDTCTTHYFCVECGMALRRHGYGTGPSAYLAVVMYAFERLGVNTVCFSAKEYNRQVIDICARAGIASGRRVWHQDDYHSGGRTELVEYIVERRNIQAKPDLALRILRRPVQLLDNAGSATYVASAAGIARFAGEPPAALSGGC